jgi:hypothetical protein
VRGVVEVVPSLFGRGPFLSVPRQRAVDDPVVALAHVFVPDTETVGDPRTEPLDDGVWVPSVFFDEGVEGFESGVVLQVERDATFAAVHHREDPALAVEAWCRVTRVVSLGRFYLDNVGAQVREQLRCVRSRKEPRHIEDAYSVEHRRFSGLIYILLWSLCGV